jgi:hypothetical protein
MHPCYCKKLTHEKVTNASMLLQEAYSREGHECIHVTARSLLKIGRISMIYANTTLHGWNGSHLYLPLAFRYGVE